MSGLGNQARALADEGCCEADREHCQYAALYQLAEDIEKLEAELDALRQKAERGERLREAIRIFAEATGFLLDEEPVAAALGVDADGNPTREERPARSADEIIGYYEDDLAEAIANHPEAGRPVLGTWVDAFATWLYGKEAKEESNAE